VQHRNGTGGGPEKIPNIPALTDLEQRLLDLCNGHYNIEGVEGTLTFGSSTTHSISKTNNTSSTYTSPTPSKLASNTRISSNRSIPVSPTPFMSPSNSRTNSIRLASASPTLSDTISLDANSNELENDTPILSFSNISTQQVRTHNRTSAETNKKNKSARRRKKPITEEKNQ
jgi:hypothetical protein